MSSFGVQFFDTPARGGFFLQAGAGPAAYLKQEQPALTPRAALALSAASGISLPTDQMALRLEVRMVTLAQPDYRPTRILMFGFGVQL